MAKKPNPRKRAAAGEERDLDIEIGFLEGVVRRDPHYVEALQVLGDDYTSRGRIADGLAVDERLARLRPEDPLVYYNLACSQALLKDYTGAVDSLERALDLGYRDFRWLARDADLRELRKHPLFKRLRERIRRLKRDGTPPA